MLTDIIYFYNQTILCADHFVGVDSEVVRGNKSADLIELYFFKVLQSNNTLNLKILYIKIAVLDLYGRIY